MKIYNTLTRKKEEFKPIKDGEIGMYVCGPTVYDEPHIGHARSAYVFDVIRRYFIYKGYKVRFVRNITDVDDKIINKAKKEFKGEDLNIAVKNVSDKYLKVYHDYMEKLGIMQPDAEPKATEYINKMVDFIKVLILNGTAYYTGGDVYFDVRKTNEYGKLSNQSFEMLESGARIAPGENKKDPLDFALWKSAKEGEPSWDSPWGKGRPGWHIECSVMSSDVLGDEFDIHGGGIDLVFPHHENEIAQSEGAGKKFAHCWIHNGLLTINKEKMAKSLGNFITIEDILSKYPADVLKILFLQAHYSHPVDFSWEKMIEAKKAWERFNILFDKLNRDRGNKSAQKEINAFKERFEKAMDDDFNTAEALAVLFDLVTYMNRNFPESYCAKNILIELGGVFGLFEHVCSDVDASKKSEIENIVNLRNAARKNRDFEEADSIRKKLEEKGIILEDAKDGKTTWRLK
ncbi:MAG: cysteine--tRNA ligase [Candidatus Omnitrophica bacterium CG12_big_fil_rev_8_21_14_0_65_42_8]|nr:MAG: cysteine--tRNA ligase [Candidatus Omnitrophica bacterium CG12_big_fil_rev_8_21_14_0_65_42_8]